MASFDWCKGAIACWLDKICIFLTLWDSSSLREQLSDGNQMGRVISLLSS